MRLTELTSPFFLLIVLFRKRAGRTPMSLEWVRDRFDETIRRMDETARDEPALAAAYQKVKPALVYLTDSVILESAWEGRGEWRQNLLETRQFGSAQGGEAFFEKARAIGFGEPEVAEVILYCVALGFGGKYRSNPAQLKQIQKEIAPRAGADARALEGRLCPAAYESVADRDFTKLPVANAMRIAVVFLVLVVGLLAVGRLIHDGTLASVTAQLERKG